MIQKLHPTARVQWIFFLAWAGIWLVGMILPGGLGSLVIRLRDFVFLLFSAVTLWMGWRMWMAREAILSPALLLFSEYLRKVEGGQSASRFLRKMQTQAALRTQGSIHILVGGLCGFTTLVYLFIL
jgi:hypothetical protein